MNNFRPIEEAIEELKAGKMIILMDDEDRENEGDLVMAAEFANQESINFMMSEGRGLICVPMTETKATALDLAPMTDHNSDPKGTAFTISVDGCDAHTGISALERANTILKLSKESSEPKDFTRPGHVFPLVAKKDGVLEREGHTEATVDLLRLAGCKEVGIICEIANEDGTMARRDDLITYGKKHGLNLYTIKDLVNYRKKREMVRFTGEALLPSKYGDFRMRGYLNTVTGKEHFALVKGDVTESEDVLIRVHSECMTGDVLGSLRCDCGNQLHHAMKQIEEKGEGILIYLRQEGRGIGLLNKINAYGLQDKGLDTVEANLELGFDEDEREYVEAYAMLQDMQVKSVEMMTNNPLKIEGLESLGMKVSKRVPVIVGRCESNAFYLDTKKDRMGHML